MDAQATEEILRFFRGIDDPRTANARHHLSDILSIAILAVLCGSKGWAAVETWGCGNLAWLRTFLLLPHGIPSHDTFDRVFGLLDPLAFEKAFQEFTSRMAHAKQRNSFSLSARLIIGCEYLQRGEEDRGIALLTELRSGDGDYYLIAQSMMKRFRSLTAATQPTQPTTQGKEH